MTQDLNLKLRYATFVIGEEGAGSIFLRAAGFIQDFTPEETRSIRDFFRLLPKPVSLEMTEQELAEAAELEKATIASINGQNWSDDPMTNDEKNVIGMAVRYVYSEMKDR